MRLSGSAQFNRTKNVVLAYVASNRPETQKKDGSDSATSFSDIQSGSTYSGTAGASTMVPLELKSSQQFKDALMCV